MGLRVPHTHARLLLDADNAAVEQRISLLGNGSFAYLPAHGTRRRYRTLSNDKEETQCLVAYHSGLVRYGLPFTAFDRTGTARNVAEGTGRTER
jgi:hypothetical protein